MVDDDEKTGPAFARRRMPGPAALLHDLLRENAIPMSERNADLYDGITQALKESAHARRLHHALLGTIGTMVMADPPAASPEGKLLAELVRCVEDYERKVYVIAAEARVGWDPSSAPSVERLLECVRALPPRSMPAMRKAALDEIAAIATETIAAEAFAAGMAAGKKGSTS